MSGIKAINYKSENVGRIIKSTKIIHCWRLAINNKVTDIKYIVSRTSGKRSIYISEEHVLTIKKATGNLRQPFDYANNSFEIIELDNDPELYINSESFTKLLTDHSMVFRTWEEHEMCAPMQETAVVTENIPQEANKTQWELLARPYRDRKPRVYGIAVWEDPDIFPETMTSPIDPMYIFNAEGDKDPVLDLMIIPEAAIVPEGSNRNSAQFINLLGLDFDSTRLF